MRMWSNQLSYVACGSVYGYKQTVWHFFTKVDICITYDQPVPTLERYRMEMHTSIHHKTSIRMLIAALFKIAPN